MSDVDKPIRLSPHAQGQLAFRGATEAEVIPAIRTAAWATAELGRLECRKTFHFASTWQGKPYVMKQVRPIFVDESAEIVVVAVYVYYF